ncbi:MAG: T9SS type A sorting domain-containing protein [Flavobacteriales bacterium]|nr:T9SS type A sorting domain-containing protein [Flavobacteriales bacterium]
MPRIFCSGIGKYLTLATLLLLGVPLFAQPANDDPCGAIPLTINTTCSFSAGTSVAATATAGIPVPGCANYAGADVWFSAVVPANGQLIFDSNVGGLTDGGMALYSATACNGTFTLIECDDDDSANGLMPYIIRAGLVPGSTVYVRFWEYGGDNNGTFSICAYSPPPPPPSCGTTVYDPGGAAGDYANNANFFATYCPTVPGEVVTMTFTAFNIEAGWDYVYIHNGPSVASSIIGTYTGTALPGAITSTDASGCITLHFTSDGSGIGAGWAANITCGPPPPPPANDNPCGATPLTVNASCVFSTNTTAASTNTTAIAAPPCANFAGYDVWFSVVVPASGNLLLNSNTGAMTNGGMALYTATACNGTFTLVDCDDDDSPNGLMPQITAGGLTPGSTVYVRFWPYGGIGSGTFNICATTPPAPPANDNPCGATLLPVNTTCVNTGSTTTNALATSGPPAPTCANYTGGDVWFRVVVPASGSIIIETTPGVVTDGGMALYTAPSCAGPFVQEACDDDGGTGLMPMLTSNGLAPGSTVYIRFWEYGNDNNGTFSICVRTPPPPPSGDCVYVLNLFDSWDDGWGSSNVGYRINYGPWSYYTVGGSTNQVLIGVNVNDFIELTYDASGPFQTDNSYSLGLNGGGVYFNSGSPPTAGASFGQLVDCVPPPAAPQDCVGGFTICNGQSFNNNSGNSGNIVDLNTSNQGCLSSGERQGTWYYFSPSAAGTIGFSIAPTTNVDYDFALWGPMTEVSCPPSGSPARCSYSSGYSTYDATGSYDTGLGNGAGDTSETPSGDGWVSTIPVAIGEVYILYVDNFSSTNEPFDLSWQLSNGASLDCTVLPVELVNLKATPEVDRIDLDWTTLSESSSAHFIVERSSDGQHFSRIGSIFAAGNSQIALDYQFIDQAPNSGLNYYRVTMVDQDGSELHSPVVSASIGHRPGQPLLAPNPVSERLQLTLAPGTADVTSIDLIDAAGRVVKTFTLPQESGRTSITLPMSGLEQGSYILRTHTVTGPLTPVPFIKE